MFTYRDLRMHGRDERLAAGIEAHGLRCGQHCDGDVRRDLLLHHFLEGVEEPCFHLGECRHHGFGDLLRGECIREVDATKQAILTCVVGLRTTLEMA